MAKKPWRVVQMGGETGRFTREQIERAVRVVKERNEAKQESVARRSRSLNTGRRCTEGEA